MADFFYRLGRRTGAGLRKARWVWSATTGSEAEALEAEYRAGLEMARAWDAGARFDEDPAGGELLSHLTARLAARLTNRARRWRVIAIHAEEPGAFALPGGFLYLTRPLLELCRRDPDEVACVVGHEMGHVVRGHALERVTNELLLSAGLRAARIPGGLLTGWVVSAGAGLLRSAYSQDQELDADEFGARLAHAAGYDPRGAIRALERLRALESDAGTPLAGYFASHPPLALRVDRLSKLIRVSAG